MLETRKISVCLISKGNRRNLDVSLESVSKQTFNDYQITQYLSGEKNLGKTINQSIRESHSEYILILQEGDLLDPFFFEMCVSQLNSFSFLPNVEGIVTGWKKKKNFSFPRSSKKNNKGILLFSMLQRNQIEPSTFLYRKRIHDEIGYYDENLQHATLWEFYLRFLLQYEVGVIPKILVMIDGENETPLCKTELIGYLKRKNSSLASLIEIKNRLSQQNLWQLFRSNLKQLYYYLN